MAETFKKVHPTEYLRRFVSQDVRPDGRTLWQFRKATVNVGSVSTAHGSSLVRLGQTTVVCGIKAELANPPIDTFDESVGEKGWLVPNVTLPAMCSSRLRPGPPSEQAQVLSHFLNETLQRPGVFDVRQLCISPGKLSWVLYLDVYCINYDGNVTDACMLAAYAALRNVRLPVLSEFDPEGGSLPTAVAGTKGVPLKLGAPALTASFGLFERTSVLADPTDGEEQLLSSTVTVQVQGDACAVEIPSPGAGDAHETSAGAMSRENLATCIARAQEWTHRATELVEEACAQA
eukprot:m.490271 g.490271  ORF g.490271 m.490271 type:complete len:290 (+) comp27741_c0_seq1:33-902(+)